MPATHFHFLTGQPCSCPFGVSEGFTRHAGEYFDQLKQRRKLQNPMAQSLLTYLERNHVDDNTEKWTDWLLRQVKDGHMGYYDVYNSEVPDPRYANISYTDPQFGRTNLRRDVWQRWCEFLNSNHPTRRDFNPNVDNVNQLQQQHQAYRKDMEERAKRQNFKSGTVIHQYPDGWTLRELGPHELEGEGNAMGHCVGGESYQAEVHDGTLRVLSLRNPKGEPHVTTGIRYDEGQHPDLWKPRGPENEYGVAQNYSYHPENLDFSDQGQIYQHYGKNNRYPLDEYNARIRQYFESLPEDQRPYAEDAAEEGEFNHIDEVEDFLTRENDGNGQVDNLGLQMNFGGMAPGADYDDLLESMIRQDRGYTQFHPQDAETLYKFLMEHHIPNGYTTMDTFVNHSLQPFQEKAYDEFDDYHDDYYHPDYDKPLPVSNPDWWDEDEWQHEMGQQGIEDSPEARQKYLNDWEEAQTEARDLAWEESARGQAVNAMYNLVNPHYDRMSGLYRDQPLNPQTGLPQQPQQRVTKIAKPQRLHLHNTWGHPCTCPWGADQERLGSVKTASKLDWLRGRKDMQDDAGKELLDNLEQHGYADADKLLPWIVREFRKGRFAWHPDYPHLLSHDPIEGFEHAQVRRMPVLTAAKAAHYASYLDQMKNHRQGVDVMQHKVHELLPKLAAFEDFLEQKKREKMGEVVHRLDNGWTIRQIRTPEEMKDEGDMMGHCVGGYDRESMGNKGVFLSVRDGKNKPKATLEMSPDHIQCKDCGFEDPALGNPTECQDCGSNKVIARAGPTSRQKQFYGKYNDPVEEQHADMMNEYLHSKGHDGTEIYKPWWEDEYVMDGPVNLTELRGYANDWDELEDGHPYPGDHWYEMQPEEYTHATSEAEEHGLEGPDLRVEEPNYEKIIESVVNPEEHEVTSYDYQQRKHVTPENKYRPAWCDRLLSTANQLGHTQDLQEAFKDHLDSYWHPSYDAPEWDEEDHHVVQTLNHLGSALMPNWQGLGSQPQQVPIHPNQGLLWHPSWPDNTDGFIPWSEHRDPYRPELQSMMEHRNFSKVAAAKSDVPLYYRWAFSPDSGETALAHNHEDHPAKVKGHGDLAGILNRPNLVHGFAYRVPGGWRLTDWDHQPVDDTFVVSRVLDALRGKHSTPPSFGATDFERLHYGQPTPADE